MELSRLASSSCPFCRPKAESVFLETEHVLGLWDAFPVTAGHALLIPRRHVSDWFSATRHEQEALLAAIPGVRDEIIARHRPSGFNVGFNVGEAAGQTVPHLHVHVIPRYPGDVPDPTGGIRHVIPAKANYLAGIGAVSWEERRLVRGGLTDPFLTHLRAHLATCTHVDVAVAFVLNSGLDLIEEYLVDVLHRGGRIRLLAGDYQDVSDPQALHRLVDLMDLETSGDLELRIFECRRSSFHPKAYILTTGSGQRLAYVGSSNLTQTALRTGVEWNYCVSSTADPAGYEDVAGAFDELFRHTDTRPLDHDWVEGYRTRRQPRPERVGVTPEAPPEVPTPHPIQEEALRALEKTRQHGNQAGLVVLATGLGKTWLSAFDSNRPEFGRVLFVAHREEILDQALRTFRRIRPTARLGRYDGREKDDTADVLFASVQTLSRAQNLRRFGRDSFDYVVIDEFHHAAARTYRRLIDYFEPRFLLGLTATPERTDGGDLLALCQENLVYRCDVSLGIDRGLLSPFKYFGVPDDVDYANIPWRNSRFSEAELTSALATQRRAENALEQYRSRGGHKALGFCCSVIHADFMATFFAERGVRAAAVHSGGTSAPRASSLDKLRNGELDIVFAVDMFNEGVDLPDIDTILMLRPTESRILWFQQFGRGLRKVETKDHLKVVDYIGNHRTFLLKAQCVLGLGDSDQEVREALRAIRAGELRLPHGCEVTYDLEAVRLLEGLLRVPKSTEALRQYYEDFRDQKGVRPSAAEAFHDGYNPRSTRKEHGSWLGFVKGMGDLSPDQARVLQDHQEFLEALEVTPMTKSFKMLLLVAMLNEDAFPEGIEAGRLASGFARLARRSEVYRAEVECSLEKVGELRQYLERNPIEAWTGGRGTKGRLFFRYEGGRFAYVPEVDGESRGPFQELVREICDWRLAQYLQRGRLNAEMGPGAILCRVIHSSGRPMISLPDRATVDGIPRGWTSISLNGEAYEANFARVALNVVRRPGGTGNELPSLLRAMFGPDAGLPGTRHAVVLESRADGWEVRPADDHSESQKLVPWGRYDRRQVPEMFGLPFSPNKWNQGFVKGRTDLFLLVTLEKGGFQKEHQYADRFLTPSRFQWESQNRQSRSIPSGVILRDHAAQGFRVHLFVRKRRKVGSRAAPFLYCGPVRFLNWDGDKPITVTWELENAVPERLWEELGVR